MSDSRVVSEPRRLKRTAEKELAALKKKKARLNTDLTAVQSRIGLIKTEIQNRACEEQEAQCVSVSWTIFMQVAERSRKAWTKVEVNGVSSEHHYCRSPDCWYKRHHKTGIDALHPHMVLYTLEGPIEPLFQDITLCDRCFKMSTPRERVRLRQIACLDRYVHIPEETSYEKDKIRVHIDPEDYEPDLAEYLRRSAAGEDTMDMELKWY